MAVVGRLAGDALVDVHKIGLRADRERDYRLRRTGRVSIVVNVISRPECTHSIMMREAGPQPCGSWRGLIGVQVRQKVCELSVLRSSRQS
jgi:hypothetical protein